ncbi:MAG: helix-turn-helix domain-containing protein [Chloroflexota bacterium]
MHTLRKRILDILKENNGATVSTLAKALGMASVSVRHHLDILQGDNLICVATVAREGNVGRPKQIYGLTEEAESHFPDNFGALSSSLVRQLKAVLPPEQLCQTFQTVAREMAGELDGLDKADLEKESPEEYLERIVDFLNARGYLSRWESVDNDELSGYLLHKHNCPYLGVSSEHPELCMMDQMLVDELVGCQCQRTRSMVTDGHCCTYFIPLADFVNDDKEVESGTHRATKALENEMAISHRNEYP